MLSIEADPEAWKHFTAEEGAELKGVIKDWKDMLAEDYKCRAAYDEMEAVRASIKWKWTAWFDPRTY